MMKVDAFKLTRWFDVPHDASGPYDDETRERIISDLYQATRVGVSVNDVLIAATPDGATTVERVLLHDVKAVWIDHVSDVRWERTRFWMNESSVRDLLAYLETGVARVSFDSIFIGAQS